MEAIVTDYLLVQMLPDSQALGMIAIYVCAGRASFSIAAVTQGVESSRPFRVSMLSCFYQDRRSSSFRVQRERGFISC